MSPTDPVIGTPSLLLLAIMAILTFATVARWVRAPRRIVVAAVVASIAFALHNALIGRETYGDYWGTFPGYQLTTSELRVLYATQALVFVGGSGVFLAGVSKWVPRWVVPFLWVMGGSLVSVTVLFVSNALASLFHWPWVANEIADGAKFWPVRLAMAYVFIGLVALTGRKRKATAEVERRSTWQRLQFAPALVGLLAIMGATLDRAAERADNLKVEEEATRIDTAKRLRADGDRLASEGRWNEALVRYDQAEPLDHKDDLETGQKLSEMKAHVGAVVFDKDFEDRGTAP